jgi:DNA-directed RNA polymerase sigma subunit (sigma70/sigma32)
VSGKCEPSQNLSLLAMVLRTRHTEFPQRRSLSQRMGYLYGRRLAEEQITLVELAEEFGVSRERVRQIEVSAFEKVQNAVNQRDAAGAPSGQMWV